MRSSFRLFGGNSALRFYDFATGTAKPVAGIEPMQSRFDIVPGGRSIFSAKTEKQNTDLMLVENFQ